VSEAAAPINVAGVKLAPTGRTFACDSGALALRKGDRVVVTWAAERGAGGGDDHGVEVATVVVPSGRRPATPPLPRVLRVADARDLGRLAASERRTADALRFARERARALGLPIKVFRAELHHGGARATFYFASETRIDFRELVRELGAQHRGRVELRQVGVRDEAKMVGGIGSCGRELCCTTFLPRFAPVSIKMAKHQNLVLNPAKVSGQCGRLKCCLVYEDANYVEAAKRLPRAGKRVSTPDGVGRVGDLDVLAGRVRVYFEDQPPKVYGADEVTTVAAPGAPVPTAAADDDAPPEGVPSD
jgi:cell fate regulator YaaT (PSP1 superfamily)